MAKIRVQDLARSMGLEQQDLLFKLKSIGVRVEGEEALIDTDIIQAILQGKRLPQPREVILRDDEAEAEPPRPAPASPPPPLRRTGPRRRTMIQRVEPRIREIEVRHKPSEASELEVEPHLDAEVSLDATAETLPEVEQGKAAGPEAAAGEADAVAEAKAAEEKKAAEERKAAEEKKAAEERKAAQEKKAAEERKATEERKAKTVSKVDRKPPARIKEKPKEIPKMVDRKKAATPARPAESAGARRRDRRTARPPHRAVRPDSRRAAAPVQGGDADKARQPVSERGKRRAQRKKEEAPRRSAGGLQFKSDRPSGPVTIAEGMTVREFAEKLDVKAKDLIKALVLRGVMANINHVLDTETAASLAEELGVETMTVTFEEEVQLQQETRLEGESTEKLERAPVVTVMGHVDHGKTTLLDRIRSASVAEGEAGGITQHIGAYRVEAGGRPIVFLDTPGHEAFTMMRARGTRVTDIVVLVVAADDSVMPQTIEAINHAKAANVPIVVAINKIDRPNANLDRVRKELADHGLMVEDWGGDVVSVPISAKLGQGVDDLLEMILLTAEILELEAAPSISASGAILEARKEAGRGIIATVLVQNGTLETGDVFVAGACWGRVRQMLDDHGQKLTTASPSTPVEVTGFTDVPNAGDLFQVMEDESKARSIAELRKAEARQRELRPQAGKLSLEQLFSQMKESDEVKELPVVVKADVDGSVEVLRDTLFKLSTEKVRLKVIHSSVGAITTNDVLLASASEAIVVGFNVRPERNAASLAEKEEIDIRLHTVIYELVDELKKAMTGLLEPTFKEVQTGAAEVRDTFKVPKFGVVAGSHVVEGFIPRNAQVRLLRDNRVIYEGRIASLRRFKDDVSEVRNGFDCGIGLERFQDIKPGDLIEAFTQEEVAPEL